MQNNIEQAIQRLPQVQGTPGEIYPSKDLIRLLNITDKLAQAHNDQYISSELFVLAALEDKGALGDILRSAGVNKSALEKAIKELVAVVLLTVKVQSNNIKH